MSHKSKVSLNEQLRQEFFSRLAIGRSRDLDKRNGLDTRRLIYSWGSYKTYFKVGKRYLAWCKRQGFRCRTLADCRPYCDLWLQENIQRGLSAYTLKLYTATLSKIYSTSSDAFIKTPTRHRKDITRSRKPAVRDKNFNPELHQNTINFLLSTGLRRNEANSLRGLALFVDSDEADGMYLMDTLPAETFEDMFISKTIIQNVLHNLEKRDKIIMNLRFMQGKTQTQVADIVGISQAQVSRIEKNIISSVKKQLEI
jgi:RNA polymerase sigma factor (sigma-70 family)